ncbi:putative NAD dependent epimerase/dehydratase [Xylaria acuta]|nr:putative NAD dependent epimerase/dehydratase [Xylaria acuta]
MSPTIFVVAATGTLGKALALDLRKIGWNVHATTRRRNFLAVGELADAGVKLFPGDWDNEQALRDGMAGCDGLFLNLTPSFTDWEADVRQGKAIIAIAKASGIKHLVHSTGIIDMMEDFEPNSLLATFLNNKKLVEDAARAADFEAYTILRPASFMANWVAPKVIMYPGLAGKGTFETAYEPDTVLPLADEHDVAAFSIAAFKEPARFGGREIEIASETRTVEEVLELLSQATGRQLEARYLPDEEIDEKAKKNIFLAGQRASRTLINFFNMDEMAKWGIPLHTFPEFLQREKASVERTYHQGLVSPPEHGYISLPFSA